MFWNSHIFTDGSQCDKPLISTGPFLLHDIFLYLKMPNFKHNQTGKNVWQILMQSDAEPWCMVALQYLDHTKTQFTQPVCNRRNILHKMNYINCIQIHHDNPAQPLQDRRYNWISHSLHTHPWWCTVCPCDSANLMAIIADNLQVERYQCEPPLLMQTEPIFSTNLYHN